MAELVHAAATFAGEGHTRKETRALLDSAPLSPTAQNSHCREENSCTGALALAPVCTILLSHTLLNPLLQQRAIPQFTSPPTVHTSLLSVHTSLLSVTPVYSQFTPVYSQFTPLCSLFAPLYPQFTPCYPQFTPRSTPLLQQRAMPQFTQTLVQSFMKYYAKRNR